MTVADDGGSSGVLRTELGIPPVGDIRNCIVALADAEPLMSELLQYRFPEAPGGETGGLAGHALGNLLIAAMTAVEDGDFEDGIRLMNRILAVRGQVVPVSPTPLTLHARLADGSVVDGQSQVMRTSGIDRVWLTPEDVRASDDALTAIAEAELIVLGPGSLYTSLLPSLLIPAIRDAVARAARAADLRLQRGDAGRRDDRVRPGRPRRGARRAHDPDARRHRAGQQPSGGPARSAGRRRRRRTRSRCAGRRRPRRSRGSSSTTSSTRTNAHHHDPARLAAAIIRAFEGEAGIRRRTAGRTASRSA